MNLKMISKRKRVFLIAGVAGVIAVGGFFALRATESEVPAPTQGMAGMEGMQMGGPAMPMDGSVQLTAGQIREFGVTFGTVEDRLLESRVRTVGFVTFDETRVAQVVPKFGGIIERLYVDFTGQPVRAGQPLVEIYSPELVSAQEELLLAAGLDESLGQSPIPGVTGGASRLSDVARRRLQLWDISEAQVEQILRTGQVRRTLTLHAPVSGIVVAKQVLRGQAVQPGQALYTIADLSRVWVEAELREMDAGSVVEGSEAIVELSAFPGRPIRGRVEYVYPTLQEQARTLKARIAVANPDGRIKPGMYATVRLSGPSRTALTVAASSVIHTGERQVVFVDMGGGRLMPREVEVGGTAGEYVEILAGLEPGQRVVTSAQYLLDSESNMAEVMRSMMGMMGAGDMGTMDMGGMDMSGGSMGEMRMDDMDTTGADMTEMTMPPERE